MKRHKDKDIWTLTSSGLHGQYVLWRGQPGWTGIDSSSTASLILRELERTAKESKNRTSREAAPSSDGASRATADSQLNVFDGDSAPES